MKQIIYARKCAFCNEEFNFTTKESDSDQYSAFKDYLYKPINSNAQDMLSADVDFYFKDIDKIIKNKIYSGVYGKDKVLS